MTRLVPVGGKLTANRKVGDVADKVDARYFRPTEVETLVSEPCRTKAMLGQEPPTTPSWLVVKLAGFWAYDYRD